MAEVERSREYFAATPDHKLLAEEMKRKITLWRTWASSNGLMQLWANKMANYYGRSASGNSSQSVTAGGTEGELSMIKINELHSLIQEQLVTVTSQRPAGQAKAINPDTKSLKAAKIGTAIAEYYLADQGFEAKFVNCAEVALLGDEGYLDLFWDKSAGAPIAVDNDGVPEMAGDCLLRVHGPWNVTRDPGIPVDMNRWNILTFPGNRFDFASAYPKFADEIINSRESGVPSIGMNDIPDGSDSIYVHLLVHDRTPAVPNGRYSLLIGDDIVLDTELPFRDYPIERMTPADVIDGCTGYSAANDIMGLEEVSDALNSIIVTNQTTFGGQTIVGPTGSNINWRDLAKGSRFFEMEPDLVDKLKVLQLTSTAPEIFGYLTTLSSKKERAVGSVSTALAQQASQGASGSSMALVQSQSISFNSGTQRSYFKLLSRTMTKLIGILAVYADTPRVARIVGKSRASGLKEFKYTGKDLNSISSIIYEMINPVAQTQGGRLTFAQDLIKAGMIKSPKQYITLATTGQMESLTEDDEADQMLILEENEALTEARVVKAVISEIHVDHIKSHNSLITQEAKESDPDLVSRVLAHVQEHLQLWMQASTTNPGILIATGQQPLMPPQGMMPPPPGAPQGAGQMVGEGQAPAEHTAEGVKHPELPNIAGSKQKPTIPGVTDVGLT